MRGPAERAVGGKTDLTYSGILGGFAGLRESRRWEALTRELPPSAWGTEAVDIWNVGG